jgi:hypothetical protein
MSASAGRSECMLCISFLPLACVDCATKWVARAAPACAATEAAKCFDCHARQSWCVRARAWQRNYNHSSDELCSSRLANGCRAARGAGFSPVIEGRGRPFASRLTSQLPCRRPFRCCWYNSGGVACAPTTPMG